MYQHSFDVEIARLYGVNCAIILRYLQFWINHNRERGLNYRDGMYWTYNSIQAMTEAFPYMTERQIRYAMKQLRDEGIIVIANHNKTPRDRTLWYAITEYGESVLNDPSCALVEEDDMPDDVDNLDDVDDSPEEVQQPESHIEQNCQNQNCQMHLTKLPNAFDKTAECIWQNCQMHLTKPPDAFDKTATPLPVISPVIYTDRDADRERESARARVSPDVGVDGTHTLSPSPGEVRAYVAENGYAIDAQRFWDYYEAVNWRSNGEYIRDWRAKVRTWASREKQFQARAPAGAATNYAQREYSSEHYDSLFFDVLGDLTDHGGGRT